MEISSVQVMSGHGSFSAKVTEEDGPMFNQILGEVSEGQKLVNMDDKSDPVPEEAEREEALAFSLMDLSWMMMNNNDQMNLDQTDESLGGQSNIVTASRGTLEVIDQALVDSVVTKPSVSALSGDTPSISGVLDWQETVADIDMNLEDSNHISPYISKVDGANQDMTMIDQSVATLSSEINQDAPVSSHGPAQDKPVGIDGNLTTNRTDHQGLDIVANERFSEELEAMSIETVAEDNKISPQDQEGLRRTNDSETKYSDLVENAISDRIQGNGLNTDKTPISEINFDDNIQLVNDALDEMMDLDISTEGNSMRVKLNPDELGHIDLSVRMEEGKLLVKIMVESEQVRDLFNLHMDKLSDKLISQNISVERLDLDFDYNPFSQSNSNNNHDPRNNTSNQSSSNYSRGLNKAKTQEVTPKGRRIISSKGLNILV